MKANLPIGPLAVLALGAIALWWLYRRAALPRVSGSVEIDTYTLEGEDFIRIAPRDFPIPTVARIDFGLLH